MICISIRQPWAWLIANGHKDIENRTWKFIPTYRGELYIHASKSCTKAQYQVAVDFAQSIDPSIQVPALKQLERGGLIAKCYLTNVVTASDSPWFVGRIGFVLKDAQKIDFIPCNGQLGFFCPAAVTENHFNESR